ncbi:Zona pellucida domain-containing protein [Strongyloides ratti]|uniref:Zona pellucida domain-containing protein n=1 Tax=Strongyloides ratti TaxID=34506 RepID=A0A090LFE9_STRRB|nr:Zona pellucida domain-containing protein [Strongyloides ratti]CEF68497.1 Zona pellucida domain-containing protein [Strongyloides ratti]
MNIVVNIYYLFIFSIFIVFIENISIDNQIIGVPLIQCTDNSIIFSIKTKNIFRGNIYIKGQYGLETCRHEYFQNSENSATFVVRIGDCGMKRVKQLQPHGINYILVFVTTFHPQFVTVVDKAYNVRCFYAQADTEVRSVIDIGTIQIENLEQASTHIPNCAYSVRMSTVDGQPVKFARIGDQLVHRWECDNPEYGILVKNCFVGDGGSAAVQVVDSRGCPIFSPVIQGQITYSDNLKLAFVPVWAYKFPDRSQIYFKCQIQVCNIRENECLGITPPNCPIISRHDFVPNAFINPSIDPDKVIGTFTADEIPSSSKSEIIENVNKGIIKNIINNTVIPPLMKDAVNKIVRSVHDVKTFKHFLTNPFKRQKINMIALNNNEEIKENNTTAEDNDMDLIDKPKITRIRPKSEHIFETLNRVKRNLSIFKNNKNNYNKTFENATVIEKKLIDVTTDPVIISDPEIITKENKPFFDNNEFFTKYLKQTTTIYPPTFVKFNSESSESSSWCLHKTLLTFLILIMLLLVILLIIVTLSLLNLFYRLRHGYNLTKGFYNCRAVETSDYNIPPTLAKRSQMTVSSNNIKKFTTKNLNDEFTYSKRY